MGKEIKWNTVPEKLRVASTLSRELLKVDFDLAPGVVDDLTQPLKTVIMISGTCSETIFQKIGVRN